LQPSTEKIWVVSNKLRPLYPKGKARYKFYRRLDGPRSRFGRVSKVTSLSGSHFLYGPSRSESLYSLSYPGHCMQSTKSRISLCACDMHCLRSAGYEITAGKISQLSEQLKLGVAAVTLGLLLNSNSINTKKHNYFSLRTKPTSSYE
jgi:hypothetical protein